MPCLLYCITQPGSSVAVASGICNATVNSREVLGLRVYWSNVEDADSCFGNADSLKQAALQFHQVLREILAVSTPISFRFPTFLENEEALERHLAADQELYREALERVDNAVQYEVTATWSDEQQADLATPVSGREYLKRRHQAAGRIAAVETKLKSVTAESVREWRGRQERKSYRWFALVPRDRRESFVASLRGAGGSEGVRLRLSGPWPPSEFIASRGEHG